MKQKVFITSGIIASLLSMTAHAATSTVSEDEFKFQRFITSGAPPYILLGILVVIFGVVALVIFKKRR